MRKFLMTNTPNNKIASCTTKQWLWPLIALTISLIYWIYLFLITEMIVVQDAHGYEQTGHHLMTYGWQGLFGESVSREPLYSWFISLSMRLATILNQPYQPIQKTLQLTFLFITQVCSIKLLRQLKVNSFLIGLTTLYIGLSPAFLNAALCLFSEIITLPFILLSILFSNRIVETILSKEPINRYHLSTRSLLLAGCFLCLTFTKGAFELITPLFLLPLSLIIIKTFGRPPSKALHRSLIFISIFLTTYYTPILIYKTINYQNTGNFTFTSRGPTALYGNIARRHAPLSRQRLIEALAFIPGHSFCQRLLPEESCIYWSYIESDRLRAEKDASLNAQGFTDATQHDKELYKDTFTMLRTKPFQHGFLMLLEAFKSFYWETRNNIGFVVYPSWVETLYYETIFLESLNQIMAFIAIVAMFWGLQRIWKDRGLMMIEEEDSSRRVRLLTIILWFIILFAGLHSPFYVLPRYILLTVPLLLALIATLSDHLWRKCSKKPI